MFKRIITLVVVSVFLVVFSAQYHAVDAAPTSDGTIAYVQRSTGDIHVISPDGTNDRVLWTNPDPDHTPLALAWRPDGRELAFSSQHEWTCSFYDSDVYAIRFDGTGYRRITNAPACAELANLPKGSVTVFVQDVFGGSFVYVAGAPGIKRALLGTMTFDNVADFGPGVLQPSVGIAVLDRVIGGPPYADVQPEQTVPGGSLYMDDKTIIRGWGAGKVSWKADGTILSYNQRLGTTINAISPVPTYGLWGDALPVVPQTNSLFHSWNPTLAGSNQYLYYSTDMKSDAAHGIFLNTVGDASGGTRLYHPPWPLFFRMLDMQWLPDGSGFLFSMRYMSGWDPAYTCAGHDYHTCHNIFEYDLATQQITQRTDIDDESLMGMSVSPDGQYILFERTTDPVTDPTSSLWITKRDGSELPHKLLDDAGRPSWGQTPSFPTPTVTSLNPSSAFGGGPAFTLTINGTNFVSGSVVRWNGSARATTYVNDTRLTASITAADITTVGTANVTVFNPAPGGGTSNAVTFPIIDRTQLPPRIYLSFIKR
jgi:TolB protein